MAAVLLLCLPGLLGADHPAAAREHYRRGIDALGQRDFTVAIQEFQDALEIDSTLPDAQKQLGLAFFQGQQYESAIPPLKKARSQEPGDAAVLLGLGTSLAKTHHRQEAQAAFVDLLKSNPDSADLHLLWGEAYASQFKDGEAEQEFRRALELSPKLPWAHFDLGSLCLLYTSPSPRD